ncbi:flagellar hook-basal body complex protein FliE [Conexibacter sp. JD483]|uniref:flagellar hook-basal body complex protein FliE n=1 Tax=unclassified Conexibacter TaxID=2627773 RepID=UPI0027247191|nr:MULTISPECIES: flagellar hook-basal body complex protein FliE [unclassified Conexibacter]MDO8184483.1 flagellar hook-basal body complex protein FliE [Conexibacter sp. CPCC 205706]MDO8197789.1 flagellar hook-basal body complex protein FliE [Conexibacter sp. CPCC 205762]MDR9368075.1 flagellar hook-basal body complex protein FliE [Conexibacter sp. JD483]
MIAAIDPSMVAGLTDQWQTPDVTQLPGANFQDPSVEGVGGVDGGGFGKLLSNEIGKLSDLQTNAAVQGQSLADGTATDPVTAVMAVEKAQMAMQFAGQIRTRGSEALTEIFRTQI